MKPTDNDNLKTVRKYLNEGTESISYRKFKKALQALVINNNPEGLTIASTQQLNLSDDEFEKKRIDLLNQAVSLNFSPAMIALAEIYYYKKQYEKAYELYEKASVLGNAYALKEISLAYKLGAYGYQKNEAKAKQLSIEAEKSLYWNEFDGFTKNDSL